MNFFTIGDTPEEVDSPFKKMNGSTPCISSSSIKENGLTTAASSTPKNHISNGSIGNIKWVKLCIKLMSGYWKDLMFS